MKRLSLLILVIYLACGQLSAQNSLPLFLGGTWQMENGEVYEVWEMTEDGLMKGHSYRIREGEEKITEYLEIKQHDDQVIYTATVLNQNEGRSIDFILNQPDNLTWSFENPEHDFPKVITYAKRSDTEVYVQVSDGGERGFAYMMHKIEEAKNPLHKFFEELTGSWIAAPDDSSFVTRLRYTPTENGFLIKVDNTVTSKSGQIFGQYDGVYVYNPVEKKINFTTVTENEIHNGTCRLEGNILYHTATITGNTSIKTYTSAIEKKVDGTLHYFAQYSNLDEFPDLKFENPLIYRKGNSEKTTIHKNEESMKRVTGIGGIFFKAENPEKIKEWYKTHLGLVTDQYGTNFEWRQGADPSKYGFTQWSPFSENTTYFEPSGKEFMINYRVENLEALVKELKKEGVTVLDGIETYEYGKFVHIQDVEGNKIELWEPNDTEYDKIVEGRTK